MKHITEKKTGAGLGAAGTDTMFVLFFLAWEYGRAVKMFSIDGLLTGTTMLMVLTLPYWLPSRYEKPELSNWMIGRGAVALLGILLGFAFNQGVGVILPGSL